MSFVGINKSVHFGQPGSRRGSNCSSMERKIPPPSLLSLCELHGWAAAVNLRPKTSFECRKGGNWPVNSLMCFYIRSKGIGGTPTLGSENCTIHRRDKTFFQVKKKQKSRLFTGFRVLMQSNRDQSRYLQQ